LRYCHTKPIAQMLFGHDIGTGVDYQNANDKVTAVETAILISMKVRLSASTSPVPIVLKHLIA
jgi:hypothetical protein